MLREDNADLRLTETGYGLGLVNADRQDALVQRRDAIDAEVRRLEKLRVGCESDLARRLEVCLETPLRKDVTAADLLKRPGIGYSALMRVPPLGPGVERPDVAEQVETTIRYAGYLDRQRDEIERARGAENMPIPDDFDFACVRGLSVEVLENLQRQHPTTVGQAGRIPGVTPAAISQLLVWLKRARSAA